MIDIANDKCMIDESCVTLQDIFPLLIVQSKKKIIEVEGHSRIFIFTLLF